MVVMLSDMVLVLVGILVVVVFLMWRIMLSVVGL